MKDVVEIEIDVSQAKAAGLFSDPANNMKWMQGMQRYEALSGEPGIPGSKYRLVPRDGDRTFVATVMDSGQPCVSKVQLDSLGVCVTVTGTFISLSAAKTKLVSEEIFAFKGPLNALGGLLAWPLIKRVHRRQMESFKRFAEAEAAGPAN